MHWGFQLHSSQSLSLEKKIIIRKKALNALVFSQGVCKQADAAFHTGCGTKKNGLLVKKLWMEISGCRLGFQHVIQRLCPGIAIKHIIYAQFTGIQFLPMYISVYYAMAPGQHKKLQNQHESEPLSKTLCPHFLFLLRQHQTKAIFFPLYFYNDPSSPKYVCMAFKFFCFYHICSLCYISPSLIMIQDT